MPKKIKELKRKLGIVRKIKKGVVKQAEAQAGGGGMHQMGPAKKAPKKLNAKERALLSLRKKKRKII